MKNRRVFMKTLTAAALAAAQTGKAHAQQTAAPAAPSPSPRNPATLKKYTLISMMPRDRQYAERFAIGKEAGFESIDIVAGGETAGIPFAAWIADRLALPMQYIRKKPKGFGRNAQIEGDVVEGARTLLVEDLTTDGKSKINFVQALRDAGALVTDTFVVFHYGIFPQSHTNMANIGVRLHALATWWDVLRVAKDNNYFDTHTLDQVEKFLNNPVEWSGAHGGVAEYPAS